MKRQTATWVRKAEDDWEGAHDLAARTLPLRDLVCFHCQQPAEKYLKALLQEKGAAVPRTHDLRDLCNLLIPYDSTLTPLRKGLRSLNKYAVEHRYPGPRATTRGMASALRVAERVRGEVRVRLGLVS